MLIYYVSLYNLIHTAASIGRSIQNVGVTFIILTLVVLYIRIINNKSFLNFISIDVQSQLYNPKVTNSF